MPATVAQLQVVVGADVAGARAGLTGLNQTVVQTGTGFAGLGKQALSFAGGMLGAQTATAAVRGGFDLFIGTAMDFQREMLNVNSIAKLPGPEFESMRQSVIGLSKELPQSASTLAEGLYNIASSGFAGEEGMLVLNAAAKAASAGLTETNVSAKGLTAILNAYHRPASDAAAISDVMFKVVDKGVISFEELAGEIGDVTAIAAPLGVGIEEVGAAMSIMTRNGVNAAESATSIAAVLRSILKPSTEARDMAAALGIEWDTTALRTKGLVGMLDTLVTATGGSAEQMGVLLGDARAIRGAMVLAGQGTQAFADELVIMQNAAGATDVALSYQRQGLAFQLGILKNNFDAVAIMIGDKVIPIVTKFVTGLSSGLPDLAQGFVSVFEAASPLLDLVLSLATAFLEQADVIIPALVVMVGVKWVKALADASNAGKLHAGTLSLLKAGFIALIPVALQGLEAVHNWATELLYGKENMEALRAAQTDFNVSEAEAAAIMGAAQVANEKYGISLERATALVHQAIDGGSSLGQALDDLANNRLGHVTGEVERLDEAIMNESLQMRQAAVTHGEAGRQIEETVNGIAYSTIETFQNMEGVVVETLTNAGGTWSIALSDGSTAVAGSAAALAQHIPDAIALANERATAIAYETPGDMAVALLEGRDQVVINARLLASAVTDEVDNAAKIAELRATLVGQTMADNLNSNVEATRLAAQSQYAQVEIELAGHLLRADPKSEEAAGILEKYLSDPNIDSATRLAAQNLYQSVEDRALIMQEDIEGIVERTGQSLPDALEAAHARTDFAALTLAQTTAQRLASAENPARASGFTAGEGFVGGIAGHTGAASAAGSGVGSSAVGGMSSGASGSRGTGQAITSLFGSGISDMVWLALDRGASVGAQTVTAINNGAGNASAGGRSVGIAWINGLMSYMTGPGLWAVQAGLGIIRSWLGGSLPEDGPLEGDTAEHGGQSVGETWVYGLTRALGNAAHSAAGPLGDVQAMLAGLGGTNPSIGGQFSSTFGTVARSGAGTAVARPAGGAAPGGATIAVSVYADRYVGTRDEARYYSDLIAEEIRSRL